MRDKRAELAEQAALYRSVTARLSVAVLLDNAESVAQVRPLLPASQTSVAVVTSRWRLGGLGRDGAYLVPPASLEPTAARRPADLVRLLYPDWQGLAEMV